MSSLAEVRMHGRRIGAVLIPEPGKTPIFEYDQTFAEEGIEPAPLRMPCEPGTRYSFPELGRTSFDGLPGLLSDALPDRYGNALIDAWLASQGREPGSLDPVERLTYVGRRAMGALEFEPIIGPDATTDERIELDSLIELASDVLANRSDLSVSLDSDDRRSALEQILRVGSSAGGARAKALVAYDASSGEMRSGQVELPSGFEHWILKFDGVGDGRAEIGEAQGYGALEYAYSLIAQDAGVEMAETRLLEEGGRRHFMTRRFDRGSDGSRIHMQSLSALDHLDYTLAGAHSYEQALGVARRIGLPKAQIEQLFRRSVFNVVARNQDDHVKNIAFLMDVDGTWSLAPAFDLTFAYNPQGRWTANHQMSINGKRDAIGADDFAALASTAGLVRGRHSEIINEVTAAVESWPEHAAAVGVDAQQTEAVAAAHRLKL